MPYADGPTVVLGADGFIGRNLVRYWRARGWPVHPVGRACADFTERAAVLRVFREAPPATRILHAITRQRTGAIQYQIQGELLADNAAIHLNVLEAWRLHQPQARLVSLGSSCVYPESAQPLPEAAFGTGRPHPSVRGYALAKQLLAVGCETHGAQYGLSWLHCILATVYGPGAHTEEHRSHFMAAMLARAVAARAAGAGHFEVWGTPDTTRDLLYVDDQIEAVIAADAAFENCILNCTSGAPVTIGACAAATLRALDWPVPIVNPAGSFQGTSFKSLDSGRFLAATGWQPKVGLEDGLRLTLQADFGESKRP
jgi:nucleoside-diphosphate-sugar epimerase